MKLKVFIHFVDLPGSYYIAREIIDLIIESGLDAAAEVNIFCNYNENSFQWLKDIAPQYGFNLLFPRNQQQDFEIPTLIELKQSCDNSEEEFYVLYLHHKGVTNAGNSCVDDWRHLMSHFCITEWRSCVNKLESGSDTVGVNWRQDPYPHYSGNFWWAKSSYIKTLPELVMPAQVQYKSQINIKLPPHYPYAYRFDAEFWIGTKSANAYNMHESTINHYHYRYPPSLYRRDHVMYK